MTNVEAITQAKLLVSLRIDYLNHYIKSTIIPKFALNGLRKDIKKYREVNEHLHSLREYLLSQQESATRRARTMRQARRKNASRIRAAS